MKTIKEKLQILSKIANSINQKKITWAIGGSVLLYIKGFVNNFNDIDIIVTEEDVKSLKDIMLVHGQLINHTPNAKYQTKHFYEFNIDGVDFDIISGFTIVNNDQLHYFPLDKKDITDLIKLDGNKIPLHSIKQWCLYYELMGRMEKVKLIDEKLKTVN